MNVSKLASKRFELAASNARSPATALNHSSIIEDDEVQQVMNEASWTLERLNTLIQRSQEIHCFIDILVAKEALQSNRIEGAQIRIEDVFNQRDDLHPESQDDWSEVQNYIRATHHGIDALMRFPLSNRLLLEMHTVMLHGSRGYSRQLGEFRSSDHSFPECQMGKKSAPPHSRHVQTLMVDLENYLQDQNQFAPRLVKLAIAYLQFNMIQPFLNANGRIGRLMVPLYLKQENLLVNPVLNLSNFLERNREIYISHLRAAGRYGHLKQWLIFFASGISHAAATSLEALQEAALLKKRMESKVLSHGLSLCKKDAFALLNTLYAKPITEIRAASQHLGIAPSDAASLIDDFKRMGILSELRGQSGKQLYVFKGYLDLFDD